MRFSLPAFLKSILKYWKSVTWFLLILYALFSSPENIPKPKRFYFEHMDKLVHFLLFGLFFIILIFDMKKEALGSIKKIFIAIVIVIFLSGFTELFQFLFLSTRSGNFSDFIADIIGLASGIVFVFITFLVRNYHSYGKSSL